MRSIFAFFIAVILFNWSQVSAHNTFLLFNGRSFTLVCNNSYNNYIECKHKSQKSLNLQRLTVHIFLPCHTLQGFGDDQWSCFDNFLKLCLTFCYRDVFVDKRKAYRFGCRCFGTRNIVATFLAILKRCRQNPLEYLIYSIKNYSPKKNIYKLLSNINPMLKLLN